MKGRVSDWSLAWLLSLQCNTAASQLSAAAPTLALQAASFYQQIYFCPSITHLHLHLTSQICTPLLNQQFLNISEVNGEIREVKVEGVIFSFPTQKKLDRLEIKFNDIERGNLTARQPHHHKYRNNLESVLNFKLDTTESFLQFSSETFRHFLK